MDLHNPFRAGLEHAASAERNSGLKVLKFGGTSVGSPEMIARAAQLIARAAATHRIVVVVSAAAGVTNTLVAACEALKAGTLDIETLVASLRQTHRALAAGLTDFPALRQGYMSTLEAELKRLQTALEAAQTAADSAWRDEVLAAGERLMAPLLAATLRACGLSAFAQDATALLLTDRVHGAATVDLEASRVRIVSWFARLSPQSVPVVTGFIGATPEGHTTTLGRGGSDYSAAVLAALLKADLLERWTDVDGLYTEDPRKNPQAEHYDVLVLEEARAWNQAGRLGMHRKALDPLVAAGIPVHIRSTLAPERPGTWLIPARSTQVLVV